MTDSTPKDPRKAPVQKRSQQLVESILTAAARIFGTGRPQDLNTNRVAEVAGVSIGSLYQYFPGKDAIAAALGKKVMRETFDALARTIDEHMDAPIETLIEALVDKFISLKLKNITMESVLVREAFRIGFSDDLMAMDPELIEMFRVRIAKIAERGRLRAGVHADSAAYILFQSLRCTMIIGSLQRPELLDTAEFRNEMIALITGYLKPR